jgi:hypothetical protein
MLNSCWKTFIGSQNMKINTFLDFIRIFAILIYSK